MDTLVLLLITLTLVFFVLFAKWTWRVWNLVWLTPRKVEKCLRKQGLKGNSYRFLYGDVKQNSEMNKKAMSWPMNLSDDVATRAIPLIHQTVQKYGENSFIWFGPTPRLLITDPALVKQVLNQTYRFKKLRQNPIVRMFANGLASIDGDQWTQHKKLLNPAFLSPKLKLMLPVMYISCIELVRKWEKLMEKKDCCELDVAPYLNTLTSDVISRTAFGSSYEEGSLVFKLQRQQIELVNKSLQSVYIPGWRFVPTKNNRRMKELSSKIQSSLKNIIEKKTKAMKAGESRADDLLGILLESISKEQCKNGSKNVPISLDDVIGECKLFYFAGQETTSNLLVWTLVLLSIHQNWQTRARNEILQVIGNQGKPNFDHLSHLKVVSMIINEVLRLYPPAHTLTRKVHEDTTLGDITLSSGVEVSLPVLLIHSDTKVWGADAKEFNPERFVDGVFKATNNNQAAYCPFGMGPRTCIGQNFATLEAKLALATILQHFSFELSPSYTHAPATLITLQPQHGAKLIIRKV
ncbi:Cytochrome P450, family 72, subfamily C, polypeptide 1 [Heracleum sosnowskyi]|uniref:Cytochrome P450, family 72, subfamily C, polypeptide 1 n=1 Tax=Heracleum sosnowskyi TaxID=360622 RepID=A0AAD8J748_9APIA|nr:Cytochrome P450, family 72, subfamily C, polypeptide 1 [Heracleum sosnowskyi]